GAVVRGGPRRESGSEGEEAAVLEEAEHVPLEVTGVSAELERMLAPEPGQVLAELVDGVRILAGRAQQRIPEGLEPLHGEAGEPVGLGTAEADPGDAQDAHPVGAVRVLAEAMEPHLLEADPELAHEAR